jgi:hypothetical protein
MAANVPDIADSIEPMDEDKFDSGERFVAVDELVPGHEFPDMTPDEVAGWAASAPLGTGLLTPFGPIDPTALTDAGRIDALLACQRLIAWAEAQAHRLLAALDAAPDPTGKKFVRDEIGCALRLPPSLVTAQMYTATELVHKLPATLDALESGTITMRQALTLSDAVIGLYDEVAAEVERRVLPRAGEQTVAAFRRSVQRAVHAVDPREAEERHEREAADRRVCARPVGDGMGELWALLPLDGLASLMIRLDADASRTLPGEARTADQRRADALVALATGEACAAPLPNQHGRRPSVQVTVAATTLLGLDDQPGELDRFGPIPATMARRLALDPTGTWRRLLTDAVTGTLLDYGQTTYKPPRDLTEHVIARDRRCRFPGCGYPARRCHIDHRTPFRRGGSTAPDNCECLCPRHHQVKHEAGWTVRGDPADELTWTSPTGHTYRSPPGEYPVTDRPTPRKLRPPPETEPAADPVDEPPPF